MLWLILSGILLVAAITIGTALMVGEYRERALGNGERELEKTVLLLGRHFDQEMEDAEAVAANLISQLDVADFTSPESFRERMSGADAHRMLKSKVTVLSYLDGVNIYDYQGELINSSGSWPPPPINISGRHYFNVFKASPPTETVRAEALRSYYTGRWTTVIAHRLTGQDGVFLGVMTRRIDPAYYEKLFASLPLGNNAAIALFHRDGTMLARYPRVDS